MTTPLPSCPSLGMGPRILQGDTCRVQGAWSVVIPTLISSIRISPGGDKKEESQVLSPLPRRNGRGGRACVGHCIVVIIEGTHHHHPIAALWPGRLGVHNRVWGWRGIKRGILCHLGSSPLLRTSELALEIFALGGLSRDGYLPEGPGHKYLGFLGGPAEGRS